ncbi:MAG: aromatic acid exporter family protein [Faecalimonas sp.]|nr:aromatic acid exporter family protein [Faecalimonas sp.]
MNENKMLKVRKYLLLALKIGVGGSLAYYVAQLLHLENASSAGIIALLTLLTTKLDTFRLSLQRLVSFVASFALCFILFYVIKTSWLDYGIYLFFSVFLCELLGWRNVISVNAVIGAHFLSSGDFSPEFLLNECLLVVIGVVIAIVLNLFQHNHAHESEMVQRMQYMEGKMTRILEELSGYLRHQSMGDCVWEDLQQLEKDLDISSDMAHEYHLNTFGAHSEYYINYFRMRKQQYGILHSLHTEMRRISELPKPAEIVADFILEISKHVTETNEPKALIAQLEELVRDVKEHELPQSREEFENRALLYHILKDMEDFLLFKQDFVESRNELHLERRRRKSDDSSCR